MAYATVTIRVTDLEPVKNLIEVVYDAIGALEHGDHFSTQENVADELRDALVALGITESP